jgi:hypothetical protein
VKHFSAESSDFEEFSLQGYNFLHSVDILEMYLRIISHLSAASRSKEGKPIIRQGNFMLSELVPI